MANEPSQSTVPSSLNAARFAGHSKFTRELCADRPVVTLFQLPSYTVANLAGVGAGAPPRIAFTSSISSFSTIFSKLSNISSVIFASDLMQR